MADKTKYQHHLRDKIFSVASVRHRWRRPWLHVVALPTGKQIKHLNEVENRLFRYSTQMDAGRHSRTALRLKHCDCHIYKTRHSLVMLKYNFAINSTTITPSSLHYRQQREARRPDRSTSCIQQASWFCAFSWWAVCPWQLQMTSFVFCAWIS